MNNTRKLGQIAEQYAADYLINKGLELLEQNVNFRVGELDLVMRDQDTLVFVEVKRRKQDNFGGAISAITYKKQQRLNRAAKAYLLRHQLTEKVACRFDLFAVTEKNNQLHGEWIENIF